MNLLFYKLKETHSSTLICDKKYYESTVKKNIIPHTIFPIIHVVIKKNFAYDVINT